jgi:hypothetical protein
MYISSGLVAWAAILGRMRAARADSWVVDIVLVLKRNLSNKYFDTRMNTDSFLSLVEFKYATKPGCPQHLNFKHGYVSPGPDSKQELVMTFVC